MAVVLSRSTAEALRRLLHDDGGSGIGAARGGGVRQVITVRVTGADTVLEPGVFPCVATLYKPNDDDWEDQSGTAVVLDANGVKLDTGTTYLAVRYGYDETNERFVFVTCAPFPLGCYMTTETDENGNVYLALDLEAIFGRGFQVADDSDSNTCDPVDVALGCLMGFDDQDRVAFDVDTAAGTHLKTEIVPDDDDSDSEAGPCYRLAVDLTDIPDCHLEVVPGDPEADPPVPDRLGVTVGTMAGDGLEVHTDSDSAGGFDCDKLKVKAGTCIKVDGSGVSVDLDEDSDSGAGDTFTAVTSVVPNGCGFDVTTTTYRFRVNGCGLVLGIEVDSDDTTTYELDCDSGLGFACVDETCYQATYHTLPECQTACNPSSSSSACCSTANCMTVTFSDGTFGEIPGTYACLDGTSVSLSGGGGSWSYSGTTCAGQTDLDLTCIDGVWSLTVNFDEGSCGGNAGLISSTCTGAVFQWANTCFFGILGMTVTQGGSCGGSSGSSDGGCCGGSLPTTLYGTIDGGETPGLGCFNFSGEVVELTGGGSSWSGSVIVGEESLSFTLSCSGDSWSLTVNCSDTTFYGPGSPNEGASCDPLSLVFPVVMGGPCCDFAGFTFTVTE